MGGGFWECEKLRCSSLCRRALPRRRSPYDLWLALFFFCDLGIVDRAAEALFASRFLQVFQALLLLFQLRLHAFDLILLLFLAFIPLHAVGNAVCPSIADGLAQAGNFALQRSNRVLQRLNLELPLLGCSPAISVAWLRDGDVGSLSTRRGSQRRSQVRGNLVIRDDVGHLGRLRVLGSGVSARGVFARRVFRRGTFGLRLSLLFFETGLARSVSEGLRILRVSGGGAGHSAGHKQKQTPPETHREPSTAIC